MPTKYQGNKEERRALNAYIVLMRAASSLGARVCEGLKKHSLTTAQFGALEALLHLGELTQSELARKLLVTGGNITQLIDGLERRGLVTRDRSTEDRRVIKLALTSAGEELIRKVMPEHVGRIVEELSVLSAAEQAELRKLCRKAGLKGA